MLSFDSWFDLNLTGRQNAVSALVVNGAPDRPSAWSSMRCSCGRRWRDAWIVTAPLVLYAAVCWLAYQESDFVRHNVVAAPSFVASAAALTIGALAGVAGQSVPETPGTLHGRGRPLAVALVGVLVWRLAPLRPVPAKGPTLLTIVLSFWSLPALNRAQIWAPYASRYPYVGALVIICWPWRSGAGRSAMAVFRPVDFDRTRLWPF